MRSSTMRVAVVRLMSTATIKKIKREYGGDGPIEELSLSTLEKLAMLSRSWMYQAHSPRSESSARASANCWSAAARRWFKSVCA